MKRPFDDDARELANRLFALATATLEDAMEAAVAGQHQRLTATACKARGRDLQAAAADLDALAAALLVIGDAAPPRKGPGRRP